MLRRRLIVSSRLRWIDKPLLLRKPLPWLRGVGWLRWVCLVIIT